MPTVAASHYVIFHISVSCGLCLFSLTSLFDTFLVHYLSFLILIWIVFRLLVLVFLSVFPCSFYQILFPSVCSWLCLCLSFHVSSIFHWTSFCFSLIFLPMFTFIACFHNFHISSFLLRLFFRVIASLIPFTLLTLLFRIFCLYFTLFPCCICCQLTTLNAHHFVVMPAQHVRPFPTSSICMTNTSLRNYLKLLIEQPRPSPARTP